MLWKLFWFMMSLSLSRAFSARLLTWENPTRWLAPSRHVLRRRLEYVRCSLGIHPHMSCERRVSAAAKRQSPSAARLDNGGKAVVAVRLCLELRWCGVHQGVCRVNIPFCPLWFIWANKSEASCWKEKKQWRQNTRTLVCLWINSIIKQEHRGVRVWEEEVACWWLCYKP